MTKRWIRASELARWAYCHRAWWLQYVRGHPPMNKEALARGQRAHESLGRGVRRAALYRVWALLLAALALILLLLMIWLLGR
ncbi:MAG: hypothetical protein GXO55_07810 [Chloroflexi bacterium]|nr:hypothetical protein [Chloroflexota bacterium]